ncbi:MAG: hypothetical protein GY694_10310 [Gammaproteobacteria bacterium]|nr:hypothetical protein [Gammaproteobacteria bacterium]
MKPTEEDELKDIISEYFDGLEVNMNRMVTIGDLHKRVVDHEFKDISDKYFN